MVRTSVSEITNWMQCYKKELCFCHVVTSVVTQLWNHTLKTNKSSPSQSIIIIIIIIAYKTSQNS
jgi:hypothetical protein